MKPRIAFFDTKPYDKESFNNVIITSHQGFFTKEAMYNIAKTTMENVKDFAEGKELVNEVCYKCP